MADKNFPKEQASETPELKEGLSELPEPIPSRWAWFPDFSGLYEWRMPSKYPVPIPLPWYPWRFRREELRLDVDRYYPQMTASGTVHRSIFSLTHWIADLKATRWNSWTGNIWYKDGDVASFPYNNVEIQVGYSWFPSERTATVTFSGGGGADRVRTFKYVSQYFHPVDFEFDFAEGETATLEMDTCAHPNRPASLGCETLTIENVYRRAGFNVTTSPGGPVELDGAGADALWSDLELHDAMQTYWSRFASRAQWAMWVFFAHLHVEEPPWIPAPEDLGGIMFDDIGPNHRQGVAIFNDSFISDPPAGDPNPDEWVQRMIFWCACHEMGHAFNLAHSWQKSVGAPFGTPWKPLTDEPEARSFMNYPGRVSGGQSAFFADFEFRFSDEELLFMRHAPARFVQPGNADWFDHHGFQEANLSPEPALKLELRVNRERAVFEFMEPVILELKLTNISSQPQLVDDTLLTATESMTVILKKDGKPARQFVPYAQYYRLAKKEVLMPGRSVYESLPVFAGRNGWDMAEPGNYVVQVALHVDDEDIVSNPLRVRVAPSRGYDEEFLAQDFFSDDTGRIITFGGSRYFVKGNDVLREVAGRLSERRVALHASLALGSEVAREYKQLIEDPKESRKQLGIKVQPAQPEEARQLLAGALTAQTTVAVETFAHIEFKRQVDRFSDWLAQQGAIKEARESQDALYETLSARQVRGRPILDRVIKEVDKRRKSYKR
jgi:hypothetical protein